jgi:serine/threonine protein kinase
MVHRDIKAETILLDKRGRLRIADLDPARLLGHTSKMSADRTINDEQPDQVHRRTETRARSVTACNGRLELLGRPAKGRGSNACCMRWQGAFLIVAADGEGGWQGVIFLPQCGRSNDQGKLFFGKIAGITRTYPFLPGETR